jgi:hypothetical protein
MKKLALGFILILGVAIAHSAPTPDADKIYRFLEKNGNSFSMSLSKKVLDAFDFDVDLNGKEKYLKGDFSRGRMLVVSEKKDAKMLLGLFKEEGYQLIDLKEFNEEEKENEEVYMLTDRKGEKVSEIHFVVDGDDSLVLLSIYGDMKLASK